MPDPSVTATAEATSQREREAIRDSIATSLSRILYEASMALSGINEDRFGVASGESAMRRLGAMAYKGANQYAALLASVRRAETEGEGANKENAHG